MPNINPDEIYHKASSGRLKNTDNPEESHDEIHFISMNVEGSEEYEREKENWRESQSIGLSDRFPIRFVFATIAIFALGFANKLYGTFLPIISYFLYAVGGLLIVYLIYYVVRQSKISSDSRKYKKRDKNNPTPPVQ